MSIALTRLEPLSVLNFVCYSPRISSFCYLCCLTNSPGLVNSSNMFYLNYFPSPLYIALMSSGRKRKTRSARKVLLSISCPIQPPTKSPRNLSQWMRKPLTSSHRRGQNATETPILLLPIRRRKTLLCRNESRQEITMTKRLRLMVSSTLASRFVRFGI